MKISRILTAVTLSMLTGFAASANIGGDLVNNAGGIAEKNVLYAYEKLGTYLQLCLKSEACKLNPAQKNIATQIFKGLPQEQLNQKQISFESESKKPGSFIIDGQVRVAKTGRLVGSPIIINVDLLYSKVGGLYQAVSIAEAVAILVHELGHHYGNYTHDELDLIGVRVSMLMQQKMITTPMLPWNAIVSASVFNADTFVGFPQVLLTVGDDVIDISEIYEKSVHCEVLTLPIPVLPVPDLELVTKVPMGSLLHNIHWDKIKDKEDVLKVQILANVSNNCIYKNDIKLRNNNFQISIDFEAKKTATTYKYDPASLKLNQFKTPWWKLIRLPNL
jgi:hypothetical protein